MYQIFESQLYFRQLVLEAEPIEDKIETIKTIVNDDKDGTSTSTTSSKTEVKKTETATDKKPKPAPKPEPLPEPEPEEKFPEEEMPLPEPDTSEVELEPEASEKDKFNAIQKFIIYHKLRELQYKLDNLSTINSYKDKDSLMKFTKFLSYVITFFSIFDYKQASKLTERILEEFKKIK